MKTSIVMFVGMLSFGLIAAGCGGDECSDAVDKLEECGFTTSNAKDECESDQDECIAKCINNASCDEITGQNTTGGYGACVAGCQ